MDYERFNSALYKLLLQGKHYVFPKGQLVGAFENDQTLYLIKSGHIIRYRITNDGEKSIQVIYGPGDIFPLTPVYKSVFKMDIYSGPESYYYEAVTKLEIYALSHLDLLAALESNPLIYKDLFNAAGRRLDSYIHRLESLSLKSANRKIAHQLVYLAKSFGVKTPEGIELSVQLTHQDIGEVLGMARETVTRTMTDLAGKGILLPGRKVVITDLPGLKSEAHWD